jgi:hypothetical protein
MTGVLERSRFLSIVCPVIENIADGPLRSGLLESYTEEVESLRTIEEAFARLTERRHAPERLRHFFHCWQQTNNSASSVAGQTCRLTLSAPAAPDELRLRLYRIVNHLQRIIDEDFGAHGELMHADLYYRMATGIFGDDSWQLGEYGSEQASDFRRWMLRCRLRDRSIDVGLLFTLIHEIFTHGEVELVHPMFQEWLPGHQGIPRSAAAKLLAWITVHTGGLETEHFGHALDAVGEYHQIAGLSLDQVAAKDLFTTYLRKKASVMGELIPGLR